MTLTLEEVQHVAMLARLHLSDAELEKMREQLSKILEYIDMLSEVDVSEVAPTAQVSNLSNVMREDVAQPSMDRSDVLANAPDQQDGMFRVNAVFEDNE